MDKTELTSGFLHHFTPPFHCSVAWRLPYYAGCFFNRITKPLSHIHPPHYHHDCCLHLSKHTWSSSPLPLLWSFPLTIEPISSSSSPSEKRLSFHIGALGLLSSRRLTALQWLSTLLRCVLPVSVTPSNGPPAWQLFGRALWAASPRSQLNPALLTLDTACVYLKEGATLCCLENLRWLLKDING